MEKMMISPFSTHKIGFLIWMTDLDEDSFWEDIFRRILASLIFEWQNIFEGTPSIFKKKGANTPNKRTPPVVKDKEIKPSYNKNKGGPVTKKPKGAYAAGGMAAKKKSPVAKKMMAGGMTKKSGYMYGGMAKKKAKK